jgi:hypothetical protein
MGGHAARRDNKRKAMEKLKVARGTTTRTATKQKEKPPNKPAKPG